MIVECPAGHGAAKEVEDDREIEPALAGGNVGDITDVDLARG